MITKHRTLILFYAELLWKISEKEVDKTGQQMATYIIVCECNKFLKKNECTLVG